MANFNTHISCSALVSGVICSTAVSLEWLTLADATSLWLIGTIGGILPDVDSDNSHAVAILFAGLGLLSSFFTAQRLIGLPLWQVWLAIIASFLVVRIPIAWMFKELTIHRGAYHSILAALCLSIITAAIAYRWFSSGVEFAWAAGAMLFIGYISHLVLDEMYSVDLMGASLKRSFGSAIKPIDRQSHIANIAFIASAIVCWWLTPKPTIDWQALQQMPWRQLLLGS